MRKRRHDTDACTVESKFFERTASFRARPDVEELVRRRQELSRAGRQKQAQKLDDEIRRARALQEDEVDYLLRMAPIIKQFEDELRPHEEAQPAQPQVAMPRQQDVLAFFKPQKTAKSQKLAPNQDIGSFVSVTKQGRRRQMYYTYLTEFEPDSPELADFAVAPRERESLLYQCECGAPMVVEAATASLLCQACGHTRCFQHNDVSGLSYEQQMSLDITTHFAYDRANRACFLLLLLFSIPIVGLTELGVADFKEWVNQFQAQENCQVDPEVLEKLKAEFKKEGIKSTSGITQLKVRQYLKKLQLHKWYGMPSNCSGSHGISVD